VTPLSASDSSTFERKCRKCSATVLFANPRGSTGVRSLPLKPVRGRTAITSTRLAPFVGAAWISHVLPGLKMFEKADVFGARMGRATTEKVERHREIPRDETPDRNPDGRVLPGHRNIPTYLSRR
jgi:hypothetical protein